MASITATIVSGLGSTRTSTAVRFRRALRRFRPLGAGGQGSTSICSSSTARRMHACATFRYRPAVDIASGDGGATVSCLVPVS